VAIARSGGDNGGAVGARAVLFEALAAYPIRRQPGSACPPCRLAAAQRCTFCIYLRPLHLSWSVPDLHIADNCIPNGERRSSRAQPMETSTPWCAWMSSLEEALNTIDAPERRRCGMSTSRRSAYRSADHYRTSGQDRRSCDCSS